MRSTGPAWAVAAAIISASMLLALVAVSHAVVDGLSWTHVGVLAVPMVLGAMWVLDAMGAGHVLGVRPP